MDLHKYLTDRESVASFARRIGVPAVSLSNWRYGKRPVPIEKAVLIESKTNGEVTRKELRPDDWEKIWPELDTKRQQACQCETS